MPTYNSIARVPFAEGGRVGAKDGKWIQKAIKKPGSLRKSLNIKKGEKIPAKKLNAAAKKLVDKIFGKRCECNEIVPANVVRICKACSKVY